MTYFPKMLKVVRTLQEGAIFMFSAVPPKHGLYDPQFEHDSCGVGFVVDMAGRKSNDIVRKALQVLVNLQHRGAKGCEANTGDGAGITMPGWRRDAGSRFAREVHG